MSDSVMQAMSKSAEDFVNIVWPAIRSYMGGGDLIPVEVVTNSGFTKELDLLAGIDAWHILNNRQGLRGLASRVQWKNDQWKGKYPFNTFTIRHSTHHGNDTEEHKRLHALANKERGLLYPYVTIQAYLDHPDGELLSFGIIKTEELFQWVRDHNWPIRPVSGGNTMRVVDWQALAELGCAGFVFKDFTTGEAYHV